MKRISFLLSILLLLLAVGCSTGNNIVGPEVIDQPQTDDGAITTEKPPDIFNPPGGDPDDLLGGDNRPW